MKIEIFEYGERSIERVVLRHHAYVAPGGRRPGYHVYAGDGYLAAGRQRARGGDADGGRLTRAIRSQQAEDLALLYREVDAVNGNNSLLLFVDFGQTPDFDDHSIPTLSAILSIKRKPGENLAPLTQVGPNTEKLRIGLQHGAPYDTEL